MSEQKRRVIFLDFWGVMCGGLKETRFNGLSPECGQLLTTSLILPCDAYVVITSDSVKRWDTAPDDVKARSPDMEWTDNREHAISMLVEIGVPRDRILGCTEQLWNSNIIYDRVREIMTWIETHGPVESCVIIDDFPLLFDLESIEELRGEVTELSSRELIESVARLPDETSPLFTELSNRFIRVDWQSGLTSDVCKEAEDCLRATMYL